MSLVESIAEVMTGTSVARDQGVAVAELIDQVCDRIVVDFSQFAVIDEDAMPGQPESNISYFDAVEPLSPESWLVTNASFAVIGNRYPFRPVSVVSELWDRDLFRDGKKARPKDATMYASSGVVHAIEDIGGSTDRLDLRAREAEWFVRIGVRLLVARRESHSRLMKSKNILRSPGCAMRVTQTVIEHGTLDKENNGLPPRITPVEEFHSASDSSGGPPKGISSFRDER